MANAAKKRGQPPNTPEDVKLVTVHLPEAIHRKGKSRAALLGLTWDQYLAGLIELDSQVPQLNEITAKFAAGSK